MSAVGETALQFAIKKEEEEEEDATSVTCRQASDSDVLGVGTDSHGTASCSDAVDRPHGAVAGPCAPVSGTDAVGEVKQEDVKREGCDAEPSDTSGCQSDASADEDDRPQRRRVCDMCGQTLPEDTRPGAHKLVNPNRRRYLCAACRQSFILNTRQKLRDSERARHGDGDRGQSGQRPLRCDLCDKSFSRYCNLKAHRRIHTGERRHVCHLCDKSFVRGTNLRIHMRIHTGERPYVCSTCGKSFNQSSSLQVHLGSHEEGPRQRPFLCDFCGKSFLQSSHCKEHMRIHTGERPHGCEFCGKAFTARSGLARHKRIHTGERPHVCAFCGKSFARSCYFQTHLRIHTGERPHACDVCGSAFIHPSSLMKHKRTHRS